MYVSVSKGMTCYSHLLLLVCSHVKGEILAAKKIPPEIGS